jgi:hypothetical protein
MEKIMSTTGHNTEAREFTESELDTVSGGAERTLSGVIYAWFVAMDQVGLLPPPERRPLT